MKHWIVSLVVSLLWVHLASAQDRNLRLSAVPELVGSGLLKHLLPRFSLKTSVRIDLVSNDGDIVLATSGDWPVIQHGEQVFYLKINSDIPKATRFADWILSSIGQRTIGAFKQDGEQVFKGAANLIVAASEVVFTGNIVEGEILSYQNCGRCHVIGEKNRMNGVGSTPSFALMRTFPDWQRRYETFFILRPHPSFTQITGVTEPFADHLPPSIIPLEISVDDIDAILAFVATIKPADLGAPIVHQ